MDDRYKCNFSSQTAVHIDNSNLFRRPQEHIPFCLNFDARDTVAAKPRFPIPAAPWVTCLAMPPGLQQLQTFSQPAKASRPSCRCFPATLRLLYCLRDNDSAGDLTEERLAERAREAGIGFRVLTPAAKDLNVDSARGSVLGREATHAAQM